MSWSSAVIFHELNNQGFHVSFYDLAASFRASVTETVENKVYMLKKARNNALVNICCLLLI